MPHFQRCKRQKQNCIHACCVGLKVQNIILTALNILSIISIHIKVKKRLSVGFCLKQIFNVNHNLRIFDHLQYACIYYAAYRPLFEVQFSQLWFMCAHFCLTALQSDTNRFANLSEKKILTNFVIYGKVKRSFAALLLIILCFKA